MRSYNKNGKTGSILSLAPITNIIRIFKLPVEFTIYPWYIGKSLTYINGTQSAPFSGNSMHWYKKWIKSSQFEINSNF